MIRIPLPPRRASSAIAPAFLRLLRVAPAVLLVGSLLAARLLPVPGKKAGDHTGFTDSRMANSVIH